VGLLKLTAPENLGGMLAVHCHTCFCKLNDPVGMQLLVKFLQDGRKMIKPQFHLAVEQRIPALLSIPNDLWQDEGLVRNGTTSIVFEGTKSKITDLLAKFRIVDEDWEPFVQSVEHFFENTGENPYFLKIRTRDTSLRYNPADAARSLLRREDTSGIYNRLYCVKAYGNRNAGVFLMHHRGSHLTREIATSLGFEQFRTLFDALVHQTLTMSEVLLHGDALPHNIVYNGRPEGGLTLIDIDEGVAEGRAPTRDCDPDLLFPYLRYPNYLRRFEDRRSYTLLQLVASFLLYVEEFFPSPQRQQLQDLIRSADGLDQALGTHDSNDPNRYDVNLEMQRQVDKTIALFKGVLADEKMKV
jgi:hypothetical protein